MTDTAAKPPPPAGWLRPHRDDVLLAVAGVCGGLLMAVLDLNDDGSSPESGHQTLAMALLVLVAGCELLRRTAPGVAICVAVPAVVVDLWLGGSIPTVLMFTDLVYAAVVYGTPRMVRVVPAVSTVATVGVTVGTGLLLRDSRALLLGLLAGVLTVLPASTGVIVRNHRREAATERLRAEQTALLAEWDRAQAVHAERARMARELHDVVANHLSAVAIHATAALSLDEPGATREALTVIRENSVQGLAEMRRLIGLLRDTDERPDAPAAVPRLDGIDALLAQATAAGRRSGLRFELSEQRAEQPPPLPAPVELAAYRIVQESVTNALKHAAPGTVRVALTRDDAVTVRVTSPLGKPPDPRAPGSGAGLVGMRERAELLGGELTAGPVEGPDGATVWQVRAVLPTRDQEEGADG